MAMLQETTKEMVQVFRSERLMNLGMSPGPVVGALRVYPNPATDKLFIAGSEDLVSYRLYDLRGALVSSASYTQPVVPLAGLQPGVYFLTVYSGRNCGTLRFVKH